MAVRIRMKKLGRRHRPFFRICVMDGRKPRGGRVLEELGTYDPMVPETDARAILKAERIDYWLSVGAQPSDKVQVLIRKYGTEGTHRDEQAAALGRLAVPKTIPDPGKPASMPAKPEEKTETPAEEAPAAETAAEAPAAEAATETPAAEAGTKAPAADAAAAEEPAAETPAEEPAAEAPAEEAAEKAAGEEEAKKESSDEASE